MVDLFFLTEAPPPALTPGQSKAAETVPPVAAAAAKPSVIDPEKRAVSESKVPNATIALTSIEAEEASSVYVEKQSVGRFPVFEKLMSFMHNARMGEELNPVLAGYFAKVLISVIDTRKKDAWKYLMENGKRHVKGMIRHCYNASVADTLIRLLKCEFNDVIDPAFSRERKEVIEGLVRAGPGHAEQARSWNVVQLLVPAEIETDFLQSEDVVATVYNGMVQGYDDALEAGLKLLMALVEEEITPPVQQSLFALFKREPGNVPL